MFIGKDAVAKLLATKVAHPEYLLVSTNTINSPRLAFLHSRLQAIHPYLPQVHPPSPLENSQPGSNDDSQIDWRPSRLPRWDGDFSTFSIRKRPRLPSRAEKQRFLPLSSPYNTSLEGTPASLLSSYTDSTNGLTNWAVAAQEHYSFLQNLENDELWRYGRSVWNMQGTRIQINMICIWGDDVLDNLPLGNDDEKFLTVELVRKLRRTAVVDMGAVAVHFAFRHQRKGLERTDLRERYLALAREGGLGR
ncbi:MAG: hypothetical protein Q9183_004191 [Haloplaca sp. 2 TL-2023]